MKTHRRRQHRSGNVLVLAAILMIAMFGVLALAVDIGYLHVVKSQLQNSADAAALAAALDLIDEQALSGSNTDWNLLELRAEKTAADYASLNPVTGASPTLGEQDVQIGYLANPSDPNAQMSFADPSRFNAVRVFTRRTADQNGEVALFFAKVIGIEGSSLQAEATAAFVNDFSGWRDPPEKNLGFLPITLDEGTWDALVAGSGTDEWTSNRVWNEATQEWEWEVVEGSDGIPEANLFPQGALTPGNRGTVDIGSNNNSTADIARQISEGVSSEDLEYHGGSLELDENGVLLLNGDTGISAGVKDELADIKGQPRIIPIFRDVSGPGNNAMYTIVGFGGIRIVDVKLTGKLSSKRVMIQPAQVETVGGIPATGDAEKSQFIYSPVWLVR